MLRKASVTCAVVVTTTAVYAQSAVIDARQKAFKTLSAATKVPANMAKGAAPFDLAKVQASLKIVSDESLRLKDMFPDDSKTSSDSEALPAVWEKKADFTSRFDRLIADATAAQAAIKDVATLKTEWPKVGANCGGCHREYRKSR